MMRRIGRGDREGGQSLVEFSLVLPLLLLLLLGIIQMAFVFSANITLTNAVREGARSATIYAYTSATGDITANDIARANLALTVLQGGFSTLSTQAPQFSSGSGWAVTGTAPALTYTNGDIKITYAVPTGATASDPRSGELVKVTVSYHEDLVVPLIGSLLPLDSGGRLTQTVSTTMVIN